MKRWISGIAVAAMVSFLAGVSHAQSLTSLEGEWKPVTGTLHGQTVPATAFNSMKLIFSSGTFSAESGGLVSTGTVEADASGANRLKFTITAGADTGRTLSALYRVDGTTLSIVFSETQSFPDAFQSTPANRYLVMIYQLGSMGGVDSAAGGTGGTGSRSEIVD